MTITHELAEKDCGWLGIVRAIHSIGQYDIVEYATGPEFVQGAKHEICFAGFIDGESINESWALLDKALIGLVARKYDGMNSRAAYYIFDMLRMPAP